MISTEMQENKVLVVAQGSINLAIEPQIERRRGLLAFRRHLGVIVVSGLSGALASLLITLLVAAQIRGGIEDRLAARIADLDDHLNAVVSNAGKRSEAQSVTLINHVDQIGTQVEHVGRQVQDVGVTVDTLPTAIQQATEGSTKTLVSWLAALRSPVLKTKPPLLTVHGAEKRRIGLP